MKILKNNIINGIIVIISFVLNILIFAPIEIYCTNKSELWFNLKDIVLIIPIAIIVVMILILLILLMNKLKGKKRNIFVTCLFIINLGLYIQGNFLNFGYGVLDGEKINWQAMTAKGIINTIIWIIIIIIPLLLKKKKKDENFKLITSVISLFIILIQISTLVTLLVTYKKEDNIMQGLSNNEIFNLSKEENIVVIMSDTFEGTYMNQVLEEYPEYKEKLEDFTYFDNCTGVSFFTYSSMPTLLTGVECQVGKSLDENLDYCFENTKLYKILKENNYNTQIYTEKALVPKSSEIDNLNSNTNLQTTSKSKIKIIKKMYKYVLYRYLPHFIKPNFELTSDEFNQIKTFDSVLAYEEKTYFLDDVAFNNTLIKDGISTHSSKKAFKFYQTDGMHVPYSTTAELKYDESDEYKSLDEEQKRYNEALASIKMLCNYIDELKKADIYDQTTIMFLADHGYHNRFYTTLLVKKKDEKHKFKISSAPVSLKDDLVPTILNIATNSKDYGKDFYDYKEDEERIRQVFDYTYETDVALFTKDKYDFLSLMVFETKGEAKDLDSFYVVDQQYNNQDKELTEKYEFNQIVKISEIKDSKCLNLIGFNLEKINFTVREGWNISKNTYLDIYIPKTNSDVTAEFKVQRIYGRAQQINFKINDEIIYETKIVIPGTVKFKIPQNIWNENEKLRLEIEFPNAVLGNKHATMMTAVQLESIKFSN